MTVNDFRGQSEDTIMSGIVYLVQDGQYPIAAVVFIASIGVPVLKLIGMIVLLAAAQSKHPMTARQCTLMFRMVEFIGRWSMLDLFVIAILMALVNLDPLAKVGAGPAATAFLSVVILTMLAATNFDPRLLWDLQQQSPSSPDDTQSKQG
jgi:paraquat-inducible protein A